MLNPDGLVSVKTQRALYTNPEFVRALCDDICTPPPYDRYGYYTDKLDHGLYLIGWRIEKTDEKYKTADKMYITTDEMTPMLGMVGAFGLDVIMWRSALQWAQQINAMYGHEKRIALAHTGTTRQFVDFYEEYLLP